MSKFTGFFYRHAPVFNVLAVLLVVGLCLGADPAFAEDLGQVGRRIAGVSQGVATGALALFFLVGLIMTGAGLMAFIAAQKQNGPKGTAITMLCIGVLLMSLTAVIAVFSSSAFGTDQSSNAMRQLGL